MSVSCQRNPKHLQILLNNIVFIRPLLTKQLNSRTSEENKVLFLSAFLSEKISSGEAQTDLDLSVLWDVIKLIYEDNRRNNKRENTESDCDLHLLMFIL